MMRFEEARKLPPEAPEHSVSLHRVAWRAYLHRKISDQREYLQGRH
jgi:hypothetical protein